MANTEVGSAYISVWPEMSNFTREVTKSLDGLNATVKKTSDGISSSIMSGFGGAFTDIAGAGVKAIGSVGAAISAISIGGGLARAMTIDEAQFKLKTLGMDVTNVMASANEAVTDTAFSLASAATSASILGSSGVAAGEDMTNALKGVVGAATISGSSMEEIAQIFAKVSANGKISGDELMQFSARGVNALKIIGDYLGKTQDEVKDMVKSGKVDFDTFSAAFREFGDAAKDSNETVKGATSNLQSAFSRFGEKFMTPILSHMVQLFNALRPAVNACTKAFEPLANMLDRFLDSILPPIVDKIQQFTDYMNSLGEGGILNASKGVKALVAAFAALSAGGLATAVTSLPLLGPIMGGLLGPISALLNPMQLLVGGAEKMSVAFTTLGSVVMPAVAKGFGNFKTVMAMVGSEFMGASTMGAAFLNGLKAIPVGISLLISPVGAIVAAIGLLAAGFLYCWNTSEEFRSSISETLSGLMPFVDLLITQVGELAKTLLPVLGSGIGVVGAALGELATAAMPLIEIAFKLVIAVIESAILIFTGLITIITDVIKWFVNLPNAIEDFCVRAQAFFDGFESAVTSIFSGLVSGVKGFIDDLVSSATSDFDFMVSTITGWISGFVDSVVSFFSNLASEASGKASELVSTVSSIIGSLPGMALSWGADLIDNFVSGITGKVSWVTDAVSNVADIVASFIHFSEPDVGPLSNFHTFMPDMMKQMASGIKGNLWRVKREVEAVASSMESSLTAGIEPSSGSVGGHVYNVYINDAVVNSDDDIRSNVYDLLTNLNRMAAM